MVFCFQIVSRGFSDFLVLSSAGLPVNLEFFLSRLSKEYLMSKEGSTTDFNFFINFIYLCFSFILSPVFIELLIEFVLTLKFVTGSL